MKKILEKSFIQYMLKLLLGTVAVLTLTACGLKGDLYLPDTKAQHSQQVLEAYPLDNPSFS